MNGSMINHKEQQQQQQHIPSEDTQEKRPVSDVLDKGCQCRLLFCSKCLSAPHPSIKLLGSGIEDNVSISLKLMVEDMRI